MTAAAHFPKRLRTGHVGISEAAKSASMLSSFPLIERWIDQQERHGKAVGADRFGDADYLGPNSIMFKTEELAGAATASLNFVNDQHRF